MDNRLLLLLQQLDKFLFCTDVAPDAPVDVIKVANDSGLFGKMWNGTSRLLIAS